MSEVEIITMSPLTLFMKKERQKTYNLNKVHCPWTVADPQVAQRDTPGQDY